MLKPTSEPLYMITQLFDRFGIPSSGSPGLVLANEPPPKLNLLHADMIVKASLQDALSSVKSLSHYPHGVLGISQGEAHHDGPDAEAPGGLLARKPGRI